MRAVGDVNKQQYDWHVSDVDAGERIDKFVAARGEWSRSLVQTWVEAGHVTVNSGQVKTNYRLVTNDYVNLQVPPVNDVRIEAEAIPLDIVYEDRDIVVVNKRRGMVVHPAPGHLSGTLVNALLAHCDDLSGINGVMRPGIVHRIDKDTSGLLVATKNDRAHEALAEQFASHTVDRAYMAIVHGTLSHDQGTIDAPIGRNPNHRQKMAVVRKNGKPAVTHFTVQEKFPDYTLLKCQLETGRTHQIRVHMAYIGHPLVGDPKYGPNKRRFSIQGQALHAATLGFQHPRTGKSCLFESKLPQDMTTILEELGRKKS